MTIFNTLPEPAFIDRDPDTIVHDMVAQYEAATGKPLYPAQVERLLIDIIAYRETLVRVGIQEAAKQNLLAFARAPMLDYLGELVGVYRLPEQPAKTILRFSFPKPASTSYAIPAGTLAQSDDGTATFATDIDAILGAGQSSIDLTATCEQIGLSGNDYTKNKITKLVSKVMSAAGLQVTNITTTSGGDMEEQDDSLRERIRLAPEAFSTAGSKLAYVFHAKSAHQAVADVGVIGPQLTLLNGELASDNDTPPGVVMVYPLTKSGLPDANLLDVITTKLNSDRVRPLTDYVRVVAPVAVPYQIEAQLELYNNTDADSVLMMAQSAAQAYRDERAAGLGRDLVPSQVSSALSVSGVYQVKVLAPQHRVLVENEWPQCTSIRLHITGMVHG
ncbi:baseplate assembly protein [Sapientia aquatica]|uniref:Baseplate protein n=1 Tax=Sapientia aquatica TaxID=1549640 RepID=A0A4R5W3H3_9BURK|nr:baseplate J/gp47 family protein [Sapientia aquatica]TDK65968.1 baseplate protein [Sapientia aquatica]